MFVQRPLQQLSPASHASPSTRHPGKSWQLAAPLSPTDTQARPQQSPAIAQASPAGRQPLGGTQLPAMHTPAQQSAAPVHGAPAAPQIVPPQTPALQSSPQHAPAWAQACPSEAHPVGFAQRRASPPVGSAAQTNEQQSAPTRHAVPSARQVAAAQRPSRQTAEQHASS